MKRHFRGCSQHRSIFNTTAVPSHLINHRADDSSFLLCKPSAPDNATPFKVPAYLNLLFCIYVLFVGPLGLRKYLPKLQFMLVWVLVIKPIRDTVCSSHKYFSSQVMPPENVITVNKLYSSRIN